MRAKVASGGSTPRPPSILSLDRATPDWTRRVMLSRSIELAGVAAAAMVKST